jgi:hypothetical protein
MPKVLAFLCYLVAFLCFLASAFAAERLPRVNRESTWSRSVSLPGCSFRWLTRPTRSDVALTCGNGRGVGGRGGHGRSTGPHDPAPAVRFVCTRA